MTVSVDFLVGFMFCATVAALYLLYEFIQVMRELVLILRESLEELQDE